MSRVASIPTSSRYETTTCICTNDSKSYLSIASALNVVHISKRKSQQQQPDGGSDFKPFSRVRIESNAIKMEFAPSVFGTLFACLTKRGHVEVFVAKEVATRPDAVFAEEEEEEEEDFGGGGDATRRNEEKEEEEEEGKFLRAQTLRPKRWKNNESGAVLSYTSFSFAPSEHGLLLACGRSDGEIDIYAPTRDARDVWDPSLPRATMHYLESSNINNGGVDEGVNAMYDENLNPLFETCHEVVAERSFSSHAEVVDIAWRFESPNAPTVAAAFSFSDGGAFEIRRFVYARNCDKWVEQENAVYASRERLSHMDWSKDGSRMVFVEGGRRAVVLDTSGEFSHEDEKPSRRNLGNFEFESDIESVSFNELGTHVAVTTASGKGEVFIYKESLTKKRTWEPIGKVVS